MKVGAEYDAWLTIRVTLKTGHQAVFRWPVHGDDQQEAITVFDHWLSEDEAVKELNDVRIEKQKNYDAKLHSFVCGLTLTFES
jgi:hypothetical protein